MYSITSKAAATGIIALTLLAAAPVFADSNKDKSNNGLHLGAFAKILHEERAEQREDSKEERTEAREDRKEQRKASHATSITATTTKQFVVKGSVTAISGSTLTVQGAHGAIYSVNAANAVFTGRTNAAVTLGSIKIGDKVSVTGTLTGSTIVATKVRSHSDLTGKVFRTFEAGIVTAINGAAVTFSSFGSTGTSTVVTNTATKYSVNGTPASAGALTVGAHVLVVSTSTTASSTPQNASFIVILTQGLNWVRHFWK